MPQEFCLTNPFKVVLVEVLNKGTEKPQKMLQQEIYGEKNIYLYIFIILKKQAKEKNKSILSQPGYSKIMEAEGSKFLS